MQARHIDEGSLQPQLGALHTSALSEPASCPVLDREIFLLLENPSKSNNLGPVLRCATAFGVRTVVAVGYAKCSTDGSHGASKHLTIVDFPTTERAIEYLRETRRCSLFWGMLGAVPDGYSHEGYPLWEVDSLVEPYVASQFGRQDIQKRQQLDCAEDIVEIPQPSELPQDKRSFPVFNCHFTSALPCEEVDEIDSKQGSADGSKQTHPVRNVCIVLNSKARCGMPMSLAKHCTGFCHVPHKALFTPASEATSTTETETSAPANHPLRKSAPPLLDVPSTLSITLHHVTDNLGYREREFDGHKFHVAPRSAGCAAMKNDDELGKAMREKRAETRRQQREEADVAISSGVTLFGLEGSGNEDGDY